MDRRLPSFVYKTKICVICEGDEVVLYGNPCTMDIIVKHWGDIDLKSPAKKVNSPIIEQYTGVKQYRAKHEQIMEIMKFITEENYVFMKDRVAKRSSNDNEKNSSNFDIFANNMERLDDDWIDEINKVLEN